MSSLFVEAMRAAIFANASGCPPETLEESWAREKRESTLCLDYFDDGYECGLPKDHDGDHLATGEGWRLTWQLTS